MKKLSFLLLLAFLSTGILMAAIPTTVIRLTIMNKSGYEVFMKLTGSPVTDAFYYLTMPAGDRDAPSVKVFTVMRDVYDRETWQCNGVFSDGSLIVDGNIRMTFTPCGESVCELSIDRFYQWGCQGGDNPWIEAGNTRRKSGEPRMEKVTTFNYFSYGKPDWVDAYEYNGYWNFGCLTWYYRLRTYNLPSGCEWRYQY